MGIEETKSELIGFVRRRRKRLKLNQRELAERAGVGLRFVRDFEQGKPTVRLDKVNQVLALFGYKVGAIPMTEEERDGAAS